MSDQQLLNLWIPLFALWLATAAVRFLPPLRRRFDSPATQRYATVVGWIALLGILFVVWVLPGLLGDGTPPA